MSVQTANRTKQIKEYYFSNKLLQISKLESEGLDVINLGIGNPDLAPDPVVLETLATCSIDIHAHGYQPYRGIADLRSAISNWYRRFYNVDLNPDNEILPLIGSKEGIMHISMTFLNSGDAVLVPDPGYPAYASAAKMCGSRCIFYDLKSDNNWCPDFDAIEQEDLRSVKIMWVNYPNMPTGRRADNKIFKNLVDFGLKHNILIVNDNPYSFILNENPISIMSVDNAMDTVLELNSLSKSHNMAGWRMGMLVGKSEMIDSVLKIKSNTDSGMFLPLQKAAVIALGLGADWYSALNSVYLKRRKRLEVLLNELSCSFDPDQSGMFLWARIPDSWTSAVEYSDYLLDEYGIFITPGTVFGANGHQYIRLSLCIKEDRINECITRINN